MSAPAVDQRAETTALIKTELQERFLSASLRNFIFGSCMVACFAAFLWPSADHGALVIWVLVVVATLAPPVVMQFSKPSFAVFYRSSLFFECLSGLAWAVGTVIAMPRETTAQSLMLMLLVGVLMSGASESSHFLGIFVAFYFPLAALTCVGFLMNTDWPVRPFVGFFMLGFLYVAISAYGARETQVELVRANLDLGSMNQLLDTEARTDKLTGLANRLDFTEQLQRRVDAWSYADADDSVPRRPITLAYLDIDRFKRINDEFGHHVGDVLLEQAAQRLQAASTESELVARLGGDELTVLSSVDAHTLGARISACFDEPFVIEGRTLSVSCSVGVACAEGPVSGEELMRNADAALYAAKDAGGGRHRVFGRTLELQGQRRVTLEAELHDALVNGDIVPWLQPIVDVGSGEIVAAEALARWEHDDGVRTAASFIGLISETGLMSEFTEQLVHTIVEFRTSLEASGTRHVPISINVPSTHLAEVIDANLPFPIAIEITEETAIDDLEGTRTWLRKAQANGHQVWLDDFGTGSSSLSVVAELPVDALKVDRKFVSRMLSSNAVLGVVAAMVELGNRLSLEIVAEGVENTDQAQILRDVGITMAQGHLWSPAVPLADFGDWLRTGHRFDGLVDPVELANG